MNKIDLTEGGALTIDTTDDELYLTATSDVGTAVVLDLSAPEARAVGAALLSWGMGQAVDGVFRAARRLGHAMAKAADQSERMAP